mgnify:CR=1 FL=1
MNANISSICCVRATMPSNVTTPCRRCSRMRVLVLRAPLLEHGLRARARAAGSRSASRRSRPRRAGSPRRRRARDEYALMSTSCDLGIALLHGGAAARARHARHADVGEDQVDGLLAEQLERALAPISATFTLKPLSPRKTARIARMSGSSSTTRTFAWSRARRWVPVVDLRCVMARSVARVCQPLTQSCVPRPVPEVHAA